MLRTHSPPSIASLLVDLMNYTARSCKSTLKVWCLVSHLSSRQLEAEALVAAIRALEALAHERTIAKLKIHSEDMIAPMEGYPRQLPYDPASVFLLEIMISITSQAPQYIGDLW